MQVVHLLLWNSSTRRGLLQKSFQESAAIFSLQKNLTPLLYQIYKLVPVELCFNIQSSQSSGCAETMPTIVSPVIISHPASRSETIPKIIGRVVISLPAGKSTAIAIPKIKSPVVIFFHQASRVVEIFQCYYKDNRAV